jgi:hypothetical protein
VLEVSREGSRMVFKRRGFERNGLLRHGVSTSKRGDIQEKEKREASTEASTATQLGFRKGSKYSDV